MPIRVFARRFQIYDKIFIFGYLGWGRLFDSKVDKKVRRVAFIRREAFIRGGVMNIILVKGGHLIEGVVYSE